MNILDIHKIKNKNYIVLLPECDSDIKDSVEYSFENVFYFDYKIEKEHIDILIDFINKELKQLIIFDYDESYRKILPYIRKKIKIKWIYKSNLSLLTYCQIRATFNSLMEFYDRSIIDLIGCLDYSTYEVLKNSGYNVEHVLLDVKRKEVKQRKSNSIGVLGNDYNSNHNTYNQLSALKLVEYSYVKINKNMSATKHFIDFFDIKEKLVDTFDDVMSNNYVNLYCNFTANNFELILKSMDMGIPCILGNTDIFDKNNVLKKYLVLESDDDINEIAYKINTIKDNKELILKEYDKFRTEYIKNSKKQISKFIN